MVIGFWGLGVMGPHLPCMREGLQWFFLVIVEGGSGCGAWIMYAWARVSLISGRDAL